MMRILFADLRDVFHAEGGTHLTPRPAARGGGASRWDPVSDQLDAVPREGLGDARSVLGPDFATIAADTAARPPHPMWADLFDEIVRQTARFVPPTAHATVH